MGRTSGRKVKEIVALREEGFSQREIADKVHMDIKTVRRYDPKKTNPAVPKPEQPPVQRIEELKKQLDRLDEYVSELGGCVVKLICWAYAASEEVHKFGGGNAKPNFEEGDNCCFCEEGYWTSKGDDLVCSHCGMVTYHLGKICPPY